MAKKQDDFIDEIIEADKRLSEWFKSPGKPRPYSELGKKEDDKAQRNKNKNS